MSGFEFEPRSLTFFVVPNLVVRARGLVYGGREFKSRGLHLKPETKLREERFFPGRRKDLLTVPLAQALLSLKPAQTTPTHQILIRIAAFYPAGGKSPEFFLHN